MARVCNLSGDPAPVLRAVFGAEAGSGTAENPIREDGVRVKGRLVQGPDPPSCGLAARIAFAEARAPSLVAVLERENDEGGRFTIQPFGDSHRTFRPCLRGGVLRPRGPPARCRTGRGWSDPPVQGDCLRSEWQSW